MTIKVQCVCGTKYSFDVEPQNGVMPFAVNCPSCGADGTESANAIIAQSQSQSAPETEGSKPRLRMATAVAPAQTSAPPVPRAPMAEPGPVAGASLARMRADARKTRLGLWMAAGVVLIIVALIGAYGWFAFVGSKPKMAFSWKLPGSDIAWRTEFYDPGKIVMASSDKVIAHDVQNNRDLWTATLPGASAEGRAPILFIDKESIWVCPGTQVLRLDKQTGEVKLTVPITGEFTSLTPAGSGLLVVSTTDETHRTAMRIDLATGETSRQEIEVPRAQRHAMPDDLPTNVQPTAGVLLAQATDDQKFHRTLDAVSSEFFSAGQNLVELRVRLLEPKVTWVKSIKPRGPSVVNNNLTAGSDATAVASEVFNDIKRDQTGGVKSIDESRYEVRLRRWVGEKPVEWKGEVVGLPEFFSLPTVDLLTAGKSLTVFDKQNTKLFESTLSYPISGQFDDEMESQAAPAMENNSTLYFFDQGVLTAFELPSGNVKWRMPTVGISHLQFDPKGMLYVDTTGASPEDIQYSEQIKFESTPAVIMKVDPQSGKILWQVKNLGQRCELAGKYVYTSSAERGGVALAVGLAEAVGAPRPGAPTYFHIYRLDPDDGKVLWKFYREEAPDDAEFQDNSFVLRFGSDVQLWKFLTF